MKLFELITHDSSYRVQLSLSNLQSYWASFLNHLKRLPKCSQQQMSNILRQGQLLRNQIFTNTPNLFKMLQDYYIRTISQIFFSKDFLQNCLKTTISSNLEKINSSQSTKQNKLFESINEIHQLYSSHFQYIALLDENQTIISQFTTYLQKIIEKFKLNDDLYILLEQTYRKNIQSIFIEDIIDFDQEIKQYIQSKCQGKVKQAMDVNLVKIMLEKIGEMKLLQNYFQKTYFMLVRDCQQFLINCSDLQENSKFLSSTLNYHRVFQKGFLKKIKTHQTQKLLISYTEQIQENIYFLCAKYCSKNILEIVLDYPDSHSVITVLKKCLDKSNILNEISQQLFQGVKKRLLIPGVITQNILNQYLNMLKVLQIIDPHGIVFQKITVPIKNYLLKRNDTLRCIISHMTQNGQISTGLTRDMVRIPSKQYIDQESSDQNEKAAQQWQVLNVKQSKMKIRVKYQQIDLATVLVNLYGSQQAFITEYQNMLAQKLMSAKNYNIEEEIRNIQLLKMRFGENALQMCNVIVKDVKDSKKNDNVIHKTKNSNNQSGDFTLNQMNCLAVSKGYWPINYENTSSFEFPENIKQVFNNYAEEFSKIKAMRKIHYHFNLGHVNLTLSFKNGDFDFKCLPIHAVMINYFDEDKLKDLVNGISSEQLSSNLQIAPNVVKQKMSFWVHKGVVKQIRQQKIGLSLKKLVTNVQQIEVVHYKPVEQYVLSQRDQMDEDMDQFISKQNTSMQGHLKHIIEGLIISILNINGPKSPEKIHLLLKTVYKTDLDYAYGEAQTIQILKKMVQKKKITFNGETYSSKMSK